MTWKYKYYKGNCHSDPPGMEKPPEAPPWRRFLPREDFEPQQEGKKTANKNKKDKEQTADEKYWTDLKRLASGDSRGIKKGQSLCIPKEDTELGKKGKAVIDAVNAAIHLRRPLLVTGAPGSGKTSLAYAIAYELQLGPVLTWPITAKSNLTDALYRYDAIARLQDTQYDKTELEVLLLDEAERETKQAKIEALKQGRKLGDYITLGPVGTAFVPSLRPRVLLIDEIDKSDLNLPNDLLNLFEEGRFEIPELLRRKQTDDENENFNTTVDVRTHDVDKKGKITMKAEITGGQVQCCEFPIVIMTSNGERDFPPAFYRRCLRVEMPRPDAESLKPIVESHFGGSVKWEEVRTTLIDPFVEKDQGKAPDRATDQLLNAIYLIGQNTNHFEKKDQERLRELLFQSLSGIDTSTND